MTKFGSASKWGTGKWGAEISSSYSIPHGDDPLQARGAHFRFGAWDGQEGHPIRVVDPAYQTYYNDGYAQGTWVRSRTEPIGM